MSFVGDFLRSIWVPSSPDCLLLAEGKLLSDCNDSFVSNVPIEFRGSENVSIRTLETQEIESDQNTPIVLCHGYGSGLAGWYRNINGIGKHRKVYAIDWIGFGNSSRPENGPKGLGVEGTEEWFLESLEQWRKKQGIGKMHLCGHSLGGYLAVCYAEKYPERLESLILDSPVGVPSTKHRPDVNKFLETQPFHKRALFKKVRSLWEKGKTPGTVLQGFGPFGKSFMNKYVEKRFEDDVDKENWADYLYHNSATKVSGELALSELLEVGAWAKKPLHQRILTLNPKIPITFIYGSHDWMDHKHALRVQEESRGTNSNQTITVHVVKNAGHYVHLDNPNEFDNIVLDVTKAKDRKFEFFS